MGNKLYFANGKTSHCMQGCEVIYLRVHGRPPVKLRQQGTSQSSQLITNPLIDQSPETLQLLLFLDNKSSVFLCISFTIHSTHHKNTHSQNVQAALDNEIIISLTPESN